MSDPGANVVSHSTERGVARVVPFESGAFETGPRACADEVGLKFSEPCEDVGQQLAFWRSKVEALLGADQIEAALLCLFDESRKVKRAPRKTVDSARQDRISLAGRTRFDGSGQCGSLSCGPSACSLVGLDPEQGPTLALAVLVNRAALSVEAVAIAGA